MGSDATFSVVRKGYDIAEVESHLRSLRRESNQGNEELEARVEQLEKELAEASRREEAAQMTIFAATKTREEMLELAQGELQQAAQQARTTADDIVSEAQFEAFRLVTQAKEDAEATIREAQAEAAARNATDPLATVAPATEDAAAIREAVEAQARARIEEIRAESMATVREIRQEAEEVIAERDATIRVLSARIDEAAGTASAPIAPEAETTLDKLRAAATTAATTEVPTAHREEEQTRTKERDDEMVPRVALDDPDLAPLSDRPARGSFYSRRSARLPHIGSDAANGALAAVSAMRSKARDAGNDAEGEPRDSTEDMAMQTA